MSSFMSYEKEIIHTSEFIRLCNEENPITFLNRLDYIVKKFTKHNKLDIGYKMSLMDTLFIYYIRYRSTKTENQHFYEDMYLKLSKDLTPVLESFFIRQNLDLSYTGYNRFGLSTPVADALAIYTKDSENMKLAIKKLAKLGRDTYSLPEEGLTTDICRMNIIADELEEAFKIFSTSKYKLHTAHIQTDKITYDTATDLENNNINKSIRIKNIEETDTIYAVLKTLEKAKINEQKKELFLSQIICSGKYYLFNTANFNIIKKIAGNNIYEGYREYILSLATEGNIALYEIVKPFESNDSTAIRFISTSEYESSQSKIIKLNKKNIVSA